MKRYQHRLGCLRAFCPVLECLCMPHPFSVYTTYYFRTSSNMKLYSLPSPLLGQRENHPSWSPESLSKTYHVAFVHKSVYHGT